MSMDYYKYKARLDKVLDQLRSRYLGQKVRLSFLLPEGVSSEKEEFACCAAQVLTLQIARRVPLTDNELCDCWHWLEAAALFLHTCGPEDWTIRNLIRLAGMEEQALELLDFRNYPARYMKALVKVPQYMEMGLELVAWSLAELSSERLRELEKLM